MIFDGKIFKISGASDFEDALMFNGLIALFDYDPRVNMDYFFNETGYVRHPYPPVKYDDSRDQVECGMAGFWRQGKFDKVDQKFVDGKDIFGPGNKGHELRCQNKKASWFQNLWLKAEILFHAKFTPLDEPNQLIAMMKVAGKEYLKLWTDNNPQWRESLRVYWYKDAGSWRAEEEFCEFMIEDIEREVGIIISTIKIQVRT